MTNETKKRKRPTIAGHTPESKVFERFPPPLHGHLTTLDPRNERIRLFAVTADDIAEPEALDLIRRRFDENEGFTKLTAYASDEAASKWKKLGFNKEGRIGRFFRDGSDAILWTRYSDEARAESVAEQQKRDEEVLEAALSKEPVESPLLPGEFGLRFSTPDDADKIAALLKETFSEYPADRGPDILKKLITRQQVAFGLLETEDGDIASMAGAEIDVGWKTAEIADCVTVEKHRKRRLMTALLNRLVDHVASRFKVTDFCTFAFADEIGMNAALARAGFTYDGRLVNNRRMPDGWESMNVWWRTKAEFDV
ncbi:MAG TPA: GNAT family N-acetyltransferase [Rhodothermales bacterium]|nr:GNAT family N-acetyltransferase [Rhodothermales bacterium]